jgi:hypothetical protein
MKFFLLSHEDIQNVHSATTAEAEKLLSTQYYVYGHESGAKHVGQFSLSSRNR